MTENKPKSPSIKNRLNQIQYIYKIEYHVAAKMSRQLYQYDKELSER